MLRWDLQRLPRWGPARGELPEHKRVGIELPSGQGWMLELGTALSRNEKGVSGQIEEKRQDAMVRKTRQCHQITMRLV